MQTRWTKDVNKDAPLQEYPRPQMKRNIWSNLNGQFDYAISNSMEEIPTEYEGKITVPFAIEAPLSGVERRLDPMDILWYRKTFILPPEYDSKHVILHFGAVDWECRVYINGQFVGGHTGGYCPFSFDITEYLVDGENVLNVSVFDPTDKGWQQRGKQAIKQVGFWYTPTTGIWQTVWLEAVDEKHITSIKLTPDIDEYCVHVDVETTAESDYEIVATVFDDDEEVVFSSSIGCVDVIPMKRFKLWSPEKPNLYNVMFELYHDGLLVDTVVSYFGMRKYSVEKDENGIPRLFLNNKPYFQIGLLDQGYWPDGVMTAPTDEAMIFDIKVMKSLGFNMLRKHIKVEPLRWYYHCDKIGMIVWQDMVSGAKHPGNFLVGVVPFFQISVKDDAYALFNRDEQAWRDQFEEELEQMMATLHNCVSIGCWVPFNEGWGQFDAKRIAEKVKSIDPSRVVDHASGWFDQKGGDLRSMHRYVAPITKGRSDNRAFVVSEFGGYSRIVSGHTMNENKAFGYMMYKDKKSLTKAYEKLFNRQIIPLVSKGLSAVVYTQLSDVENETNGIMTYDRDIMKLDNETIIKLNKRLFSILVR
ncbi:MAG: glycoside hydrolase family 2 [Clostridia bacterium]|nr:glycoside hydrolase family 2 [Clostridia bacterium]